MGNPICKISNRGKLIFNSISLSIPRNEKPTTSLRTLIKTINEATLIAFLFKYIVFSLLRTGEVKALVPLGPNCVPETKRKVE